jgi:hypothetical protein
MWVMKPRMLENNKNNDVLSSLSQFKEKGMGTSDHGMSIMKKVHIISNKLKGHKGGNLKLPPLVPKKKYTYIKTTPQHSLGVLCC